MERTKPRLLVTALSATPFSGSEPGKGFKWTLALSKFYEVHVLLLTDKVAGCRESGLCRDWVFHSLDLEGPTKGGIPFYIWYSKWCRAVIEKCRELLAKDGYAGLHHPVLGSFRMFPRYDQLGIRYTLGPLGGGETAPRGLLADCGFPFFPKAVELMRPLANDLSVMLPAVRSVVGNAAKVLATTSETEQILRKAGARNTAIVFPDVVKISSTSRNEILALRREQANELGNRFRLVFSGRSLWWKGGSVAVRFLDQLIRAGVDVSLDVFGDGPALASWRDMAVNLEISQDRITFHGMVGRPRLLEAYASSHLFVYPTLHDSSSSAIPEAYSTALPTMTLFCGGTRTASTSEAGLNFTPESFEEFLERGVGGVRRWINAPDLWLESCHHAFEASKRFSLEALENAVEKELVQIFG